VGYRVGGGTHSQNLGGKNGAGAPSAGPTNHPSNLGFGGQLRPQSWVKQQRDRMINQYALVSLRSHYFST
jgi:hypothetical protein